MLPLRVLHIVTKMDRGGLENRLMDLYRNTNTQEVQYDFYTCRDKKGFFDDEILERGGRVFYNKPLSLTNLLSIPSRFKIFLRKHPEYRIIHSHMNQWNGLILLGARKADIPVRISHSRTSLEVSNIKNIVKNVIKLPVNKTATHKLAVSDKAAAWLYGEKELSSGGVRIIPNAIDSEKFSFSKSNRTKTREQLCLHELFTVIHVGNIRPEKNHMYLLEVFAEVLRIIPNSKLLVVGSDYMDGAVQRKAENMNLRDSIAFLGSRSDVDKLLQAADILVFPSLYEGFPGAVLEAQAAGLPCLISDSITDEVCIFPTTKKLSLAIPPHEWAEEVAKFAFYERQDGSEVIKKSGYDVSDISKKLQEFYLNT